MTPDATDTKILEVLMADGRASYRQIAQRTSLTTPTVSSRLARMTKAGLIKKFVPVLSSDLVSHRVIVIIALKVSSASAQKVANDLAGLEEVESVYITTGEGITLKASFDTVQGVHPFTVKHLLNRRGVVITSSQIVTSTVKEESASHLPSGLVMKLVCDYCGGEVTSSRPYTISVGSSHYYFCCKTCRKDYLAEYGKRMARIKA